MFKDFESKFRDKNGKLGDLAPTVLHRMGIAIPIEMTGNVLIS
jgi:2,3-bisphosphoglycerate-independent phosphoglycerate mutase